MENGSQYSGSTVHTCMKVEPPIHRADRAASKVYFEHQNQINPSKVYLLFFKAIDLYEFDLLLDCDLSVETFAVLTKADKL